MDDLIKPMNQPAREKDIFGLPDYPQAVLGNPVATLMESGVGNCFPGLEFDLRQLDVRFFPGLVFDFPGVTPEGPDGTQGAQLVYADTLGDPVFDMQQDWIKTLKRQLEGVEGSALGDGQWYLHWVEQYGKRIELYDRTLYQNTVTKTPYEGETCWWIIRLIEADPNPEIADLKIALTRRDEIGEPTGLPVVLEGKRRTYLDGEGMISEVYRPGELTASMCSPWTHDFRDCACQYWASNHPDIALGETHDPQLPDHSSADDPAQSVTFLDWMRRRKMPESDVSAAATAEKARPERYDPYEINLHWEELSFVLQGQEAEETPDPFEMRQLTAAYPGVRHLIDDLATQLGPLEMTLSMEYLYAYFSLREPDEVSPQEAAKWPDLADDLRGARQLILSVALSEMTHLRWVNHTLWMFEGAELEGEADKPKAKQDKNSPAKPVYSYSPVVTPSETVPIPDPDNPDGPEKHRPRNLRRLTPGVLQEFVEVERPGGTLDTEYAALVAYCRNHPSSTLPRDILHLAVRIDSDGLSHYEKFRQIQNILSPYLIDETLYLRNLTTAKADNPAVADALGLLTTAVTALKAGYLAEAQQNMPQARAQIISAREAMHSLSEEADRLARLGIGVPFFANAPDYASGGA